MAELLLIRHAATAWSGHRYCGRGDPPLNRVGIAAAARLADELRSWRRPGIRIVTSPRRRAVQTATSIAAVIDSAVVDVDDRWAEADFGIAEGLTYDELVLVAPGIAARLVAGDVDIDWPGGEPAAELVARVGAAWSDVANYPGGALVVTHGGPIRVAVALATGRSTGDIVVPEPAGVIRLERDDPGLRWLVGGRR